MKTLPTWKFSYDKYCGKVGYSIHDFCSGLANFNESPKDSFWRPGFKVLGYADAGSIPIRPRPGQIAIMMEDTETGEEFWFHWGTL